VTTTLDLMRHGEPVGGRRYRGQIDDPLSEKGWAQMHAAVGDAAPWTRIVSSPLLRCRAFAETLSDRHGLPLALDDRLKEVGFGDWEGKSAAEIEQDARRALQGRPGEHAAGRGRTAGRFSCAVAVA
jgi:alpha-ribazole phosphatase/probable phosphoglycerate mutase